MSTRFVRTIEVDDKKQEIEIIRDGFNVWMPEPPKGCKFDARRERLFRNDAWHYEEEVPCDNPRLILATIKSQAVFMTEEQVVEYMTWRVQKHLQNVASKVVTDETSSS